MDFDCVLSSIFGRRHDSQHHHQNSQLDRFGLDDFEMEREVRPDFSCPYCYEDHDITSLCTHLEDEHLFEYKVARRRRLRRVAIPNNQTLSLLRRDLEEAHLQVLSGTRDYRSGSTNASTAVTDSLISLLALNRPTTEVEETATSSVPTGEDTCIKKVTPSQTWKSSFDSSLSSEERERRQKQATSRAFFVQDLLLLTLFGD